MKRKLPFNFNVQANATTTEPAEIVIRGVIGSYFDDETWSISDTEEDVLNELNQIPAGKKINVRINSVGGDVGLTLGCYNALARRTADVTTYNEGYACSAASVLMLAGSRRVSPKSSIWMIHCASNYCGGNAAASRKNAEMLDVHDQTLAAIYAKAAGGTPGEWMKKMEAETWMTGEQALECKLATSDEGDTLPMDDDMGEPEAQARQAIVSTFKNVPENLRSRIFVKAQAAVIPPPAVNNQPKKTNMKSIITALVAAGFSIPAETTDETLILPAIMALITARTSLTAEVAAVTKARLTRITDLVTAAVTDKTIVEARKAGLINLGSATAEGETEVMAFIGDLRAAKVTGGPRGARPVPRGENEPDTRETLLADQAEAIAAGDSDRLAVINVKLREQRGHGKMFTPEAN